MWRRSLRLVDPSSSHTPHRQSKHSNSFLDSFTSVVSRCETPLVTGSSRNTGISIFRAFIEKTRNHRYRETGLIVFQRVHDSSGTRYESRIRVGRVAEPIVPVRAVMGIDCWHTPGGDAKVANQRVFVVSGTRSIEVHVGVLIIASPFVHAWSMSWARSLYRRSTTTH